MIRIPNPTIELIKSVVREELLNYEALAVFYDYIFIGPALLGEFRGFNIRNDEALLMFATALKDLAIELDVAVLHQLRLMQMQIIILLYVTKLLSRAVVQLLTKLIMVRLWRAQPKKSLS